jgi:predicted Fe-Mo cluster-binding NifX family protein
MNVTPPRPGAAPRSTAVLVTNAGTAYAVWPFFGKCDGVLIVDLIRDSTKFLLNEHQTADALCDLIVKSGISRLVCGFISETDKNRLRSAEIDVRLGSCACSVNDLVANFDELLVA